MKQETVFQECDKIPLYCKCGCNGFIRLFTIEAQEQNYRLKCSYRVFANESHRDRYMKQNRCRQV